MKNANQIKNLTKMYTEVMSAVDPDFIAEDAEQFAYDVLSSDGNTDGYDSDVIDHISNIVSDLPVHELISFFYSPEAVLDLAQVDGEDGEEGLEELAAGLVRNHIITVADELYN